MTKESISVIEELAFLLDDNPANLFTIPPQDILHAVSPPLAKRTKMMPRGSSSADFWMLTHGNPLASTEAALALAGLAGKVSRMDATVIAPKSAKVSLVYEFENGDLETGMGESETLPGAIVVAALKFMHKMEEKI